MCVASRPVASWPSESALGPRAWRATLPLTACSPAASSPSSLLLPLQTGCTPLHWAAEEGHLPVLQALLRDPRVDPGARDKVRTQGRDGAVTAGAGGYPSAPSLPCSVAAPLWTWPGHMGQAAAVQALEEHARLALLLRRVAPQAEWQRSGRVLPAAGGRRRAHRARPSCSQSSAAGSAGGATDGATARQQLQRPCALPCCCCCRRCRRCVLPARPPRCRRRRVAHGRAAAPPPASPLVCEERSAELAWPAPSSPVLCACSAGDVRRALGGRVVL